MTKQQALAEIHKAGKVGGTDLDLSHTELSELPAEIGQLTALWNLFLSFT